MPEKPVADNTVEKPDSKVNGPAPNKKLKATVVKDKISKGKTITGSPADEIRINPVQENKFSEKTAVIGMARMNPPTVGHHKFIKKIEDVAKEKGGSAHVILSHSEGDTKNPLPLEKKKEYVQKLVQPSTHVETTSKEAPSLLHQASRIHKHAHHLVVVGSAGKGDQDRANQFHQLLTKYNGVHGPHGYYNFKSIEKVSSGDRDPDAGGMSGISGTKMREHANNANVKEFKKGLPKELHPHAEEMMKSIQKVKDVEPIKKKKIKESLINCVGSSFDGPPPGIRGLGLVSGDPKEDGDNTNNYVKGNIADSDNKSSILKATKQSYHDSLHKEDLDDAFNEFFDESLNAQQRMKKAVGMRRIEYKLQMAKKRSMIRRAPSQTILKRARKEAINTLKQKFAGGRDISTLSALEKSRIEDIIKKRKNAVRRLTQRLVRRVRDREQKRFTPKNESYEQLFNLYDVLVEKKLDLRDPHKREEGTDSLVAIYKAVTPGQSDQVFSEMFGKEREVVSRHGQKRKDIDLVVRKGEDRKTDDRPYRQQSIQKKIVDEGYTFKKIESGKWQGVGFGSTTATHELHDNGKPTGITVSSTKDRGSYYVKKNGKHLDTSSSFVNAKKAAIDHHQGVNESFERALEEGKRGLWDNIHAKQKRIKAGSGEHMRRAGEEGRPTKADFVRSQKEQLEQELFDLTIEEGMDFHTALNRTMKYLGVAKKHLQRGSVATPQQRARAHIQHAFLNRQANYLRNKIATEKPAYRFKPKPGIYKKTMREELELFSLDHNDDFSQFVTETEAWQRKEGKNQEGGLNRKGIQSYRSAHPGSKLSMAVTTKPSKLKAGSKSANRRKSFCARMGGMKKHLTGSKKAHDPDSRINKALRKWNC